jgi:8-oxo-dGTP diphosphatase
MKKKFIVSTAALIIKKRRILLVRRPLDVRHFKGYWEFPGGKLEKGESPRVGLRRELAEELGVKVSGIKERFFCHTNCRDRTILLLVFTCTICGSIAGVPECKQMQWCTPQAVKKIKLPPSDQPVRDWVIKYLR